MFWRSRHFLHKKIAKQRQRNGRRRQTFHRTQSIIILLICFEPLIHCPKMVIFLDIQRITFFHFWTTFFFFRWISTAELLIDGVGYKIMNIWKKKKYNFVSWTVSSGVRWFFQLFGSNELIPIEQCLNKKNCGSSWLAIDTER